MEKNEGTRSQIVVVHSSGPEGLEEVRLSHQCFNYVPHNNTIDYIIIYNILYINHILYCCNYTIIII